MTATRNTRKLLAIFMMVILCFSIVPSTFAAELSEPVVEPTVDPPVEDTPIIEEEITELPTVEDEEAPAEEPQEDPSEEQPAEDMPSEDPTIEDPIEEPTEEEPTEEPTEENAEEPPIEEDSEGEEQTEEENEEEVTEEEAVPMPLSDFPEAPAMVVSVTLPTSLPIFVNSLGEVSTGGFSINNNGTDAVRITAAVLQPIGGWSLVPFGKDYHTEQVNLKEFAFSVNAVPVTEAGAITSDAIFATIPAGGSTAHAYAAEVAFQGTALQEPIANCIFTIDTVLLTHIEITAAPSKTDYIAGSAFDTTDMVVVAHYSDGSSKEVTDYLVPDGESLVKGQTEVTVTYIDGSVRALATQPVTVSNRILSIEVTKAPDNTEYVVGTDFDPTGMEITVTRENGEKEVVTGYEVSGGESLQLGTDSVQISYTEDGNTVTVNQPITVINPLVSIEMTTPPANTTYPVGSDFDPAGMVIIATYTDGSQKAVEDYVVLDGDDLPLGKSEVTISYTEDGVSAACTCPVTITNPLVSIAITDTSDKIAYIAGENFDPAGMEVTATYTDGTTKVVTDYTVTDGDNLAVGKTMVNVSYTEDGVTCNAAQSISVTNPLTKIAVTKAPTTTTYNEGAAFSKSGMVVTAYYANGATKTISDYTITNGSKLASGQSSVTISYTEDGVTKTCTQKITVNSPFTLSLGKLSASGVAGVTGGYKGGYSFQAKSSVITIPAEYAASVTSVTFTYQASCVSRTPGWSSDNDGAIYVYGKNATGTTVTLLARTGIYGSSVGPATRTVNVAGLTQIWIVVENGATAVIYDVSGSAYNITVNGIK